MDEKWTRTLMDVFGDASLKEQFKKDPAAILTSHGIDVPAGVTLKVVEDTASLRHIVLPFPEAADEALAEELERRVSKKTGLIF